MRVQRWNELAFEQMNPSVGRKVLHAETMTMARLILKKGAIVPEHHHVNEQISTILEGRMRFFVGGEQQVLGPGESVVIPPNVPHWVEVLEDCDVIDLFCPVREDWLRGDDAYLRR
ncbi:MAG: cupin domain-containing protein [Acidobacteria bacterium]|nr:cupin domain-containing protein [Acidobacteriota bacterium]